MINTGLAGNDTPAPPVSATLHVPEGVVDAGIVSSCGPTDGDDGDIGGVEDLLAA